jgi:inhibitor of KinA
MHIYPLGETAITIEISRHIDSKTHHQVQTLFHHLEQHPFPGMIEATSSFSTVTIYYDPLTISYEQIYALLKQTIQQQLTNKTQIQGTLHLIPVCFEPSFAPDLPYLAQYHQLTINQIIQLYTQAEYTVYAIGFTPGFPYLSGLPPQLATPRRTNPRQQIPAGSVAIGGQQTGIYPTESPGGWHLIGRTPLRLFHHHSNPPSRLQTGDRIRFQVISSESFYQWKEKPDVDRC